MTKKIFKPITRVSTRTQAIKTRNKWIKEMGAEMWRNNPILSTAEVGQLIYDKLNEIHPAFHHIDCVGRNVPLLPFSIASTVCLMSELKVKEAAFELQPQPTLPLVETPPPVIERAPEPVPKPNPNHKRTWVRIAELAKPIPKISEEQLHKNAIVPVETAPHEDECIRQEEDTFAAGISKAFLANKRPLLVTRLGLDCYQSLVTSVVLRWRKGTLFTLSSVVTLEDIVRDPTEVAAWLTQHGWVPTNFEVSFLRMYILTQVERLMPVEGRTLDLFDADFYGVFETMQQDLNHLLMLRPASRFDKKFNRIRKG